ncbi:MAG: rRNA-binding ribosome biosynthesis protein utp25 [Alectoria sarmentosa]|nr:MAG: rRNA-binding ribosome biosynthesis protein utp25 [Alectoria sarmentosa]CAD6588919.1 MAG: rRNA-binding ribosome biosynthesis protein utp25 [Alectoria sarmentosa]
MAPSGNRSKDRVASDRQGRGGRRGAFRSHGRGRGNDGHAAKVLRKNAFYSTRVEEQIGDEPENEVESSADGSEGPGMISKSLSDSDDEDIQKDVFKPYSALLQSLSADSGEPLRKKRKVEHTEVSLEVETPWNEVDQVEEPGEVENSAVDDAEDADLLEDDYDPFLKHFAEHKDTELSRGIQDVKNDTWAMRVSDSKLEGGYLMKVPQVSNSALAHGSSIVPNTDNLLLKQKLQGPAKKSFPPLDRLTGSFASSVFNYRDVLFPQRTLRNAETLRKLTCLHALNHIFKTRDKVIKDNARLAKEDTEVIELRDQGFTRPKVLFILPTRNSCVKYIDTIISLCKPEQQENKKRFQDSYASGNDHFSEDKPEDFRELFAGNDDDMFRLGLKFTRKTVKFFAQFYSSDIIFASPLGLRMAIGPDDPKKQDYDFLSSIEIVVIDQADAILMQNWEHVEFIFEHLNLQPKEAHGCDFSRVRDWYLDGNAKYLRQTILSSSFNFPSLNRLFGRHMLNIAGKMKYSSEEDGAMIDLGISARQIFSRLDVTSLVAEPDDRFNYFAVAVLPSLAKYSKHDAGVGRGVLIYFPSYADFVRVRNYLASSSDTQHISFGSISEYTTGRDVARARSNFFSGRHSVLLYTERAHHFRRYHLKGVKRVVMYGLPENPLFYKEVVGGYLGSSISSAKLNARETNVRILFSKLDTLKLERIVGTGRHLPMLREKGGDTFDFV